RNVLGLAGLVTFFALWQVSSNLGVIDDLFFSSPAGVYLAAVREAQLPRFWRDVQYSLTEVSVGFLASFVLAVPLGLLIGWYRRVSFAFDPWLNFLNAIPRPALIPLVVLWVGLGIEMKTIIVFLGGFFSIILPTVEGVRTVDQQLLDVAHSFRASQRRLFTSVVIPATVPFIAAGVRLALGRLLIGVVGAERLRKVDVPEARERAAQGHCRRDPPPAGRQGPRGRDGFPGRCAVPVVLGARQRRIWPRLRRREERRGAEAGGATRGACRFAGFRGEVP